MPSLWGLGFWLMYVSTQMPPLWGNLDALQNRGYKPLPQAKMNTSCQKLYTPQ